MYSLLLIFEKAFSDEAAPSDFPHAEEVRRAPPHTLMHRKGRTSLFPTDCHCHERG